MTTSTAVQQLDALLALMSADSHSIHPFYRSIRDLAVMILLQNVGGDGCLRGGPGLGQDLQGIHRRPARLPLDGQAQGKTKELREGRGMIGKAGEQNRLRKVSRPIIEIDAADVTLSSRLPGSCFFRFVRMHSIFAKWVWRVASAAQKVAGL